MEKREAYWSNKKYHDHRNEYFRQNIHVLSEETQVLLSFPHVSRLQIWSRPVHSTYFSVLIFLVKNRSSKKAQEKARMLLALNKHEVLEFETARETPLHDFAGLSPDSIKKLSETFMLLEDELENGCSRQLVVNSLVSLEAISDEKAERFIDRGGYRTEVKEYINWIEKINAMQLYAKGILGADWRDRERL